MPYKDSQERNRKVRERYARDRDVISEARKEKRRKDWEAKGGKPPKQTPEERREKERIKYANLTPEEREHRRKLKQEWKDRNRAEFRQKTLVWIAGLPPEKKEARRLYALEYRRKHRDKYNAMLTQKRGAMRQEILDVLGGRCIDCWNSDARVLQAHHTQMDGAYDRYDQRRKNSGRKGPGTYEARILKRIQEEPGSLELLCANCHLIRHWVERNEGGTNDEHQQ